jgi:hypothetical protein
MFEVKLDGVDELLKKLDKYQGQITELHKTVPEELMTWQRDDMRRKYPNIAVDDSDDLTVASTEIWPHSRVDEHKKGPKRHRPNRTGPGQHPGPLPRSTRPILRTELLEKLHDRMTTLTSEAMKWP